MIDAVVLAAGAGRRMGNRPKALLRIGGETFLERVVRNTRAGGVSNVWVVIRVDEPGLEEITTNLGVREVRNPDPLRGMFSSVQCGLAAALAGDSRPEGFLIIPVDHPHVGAATIRILASALGAVGGRAWIQPAHQDRPGHPIAVGWATAEDLLSLDPVTPLNTALRSLGLSPARVAVDDPGIHANLNLPGDLS